MPPFTPLRSDSKSSTLELDSTLTAGPSSTLSGDSELASSSPIAQHFDLGYGSNRLIGHDHERTLVAAPPKLCSRKFTTSVLVFLILAIVLALWRSLSPVDLFRALDHLQTEVTSPAVLYPTVGLQGQSVHGAQKWLQKHSTSNYDAVFASSRSRPRAALISLVRNEELDGILQSMRQLEYLWNRRHNYPWIFFSEAPFSEEFKNATSAATSSSTAYHLIPYFHWSTPPHINESLHHDSLTYLSFLNVGKGHLLSYRHMCRWNSGFFYRHPALADLDYYWRVEPDVHFFCFIPYDVFQFMHDNELVYGFNMNILEDARSFPSLWAVTMEFARTHTHLLHPSADWSWLVDDDFTHGATGGYNNCQFFSNFEIGSLNFFRSEAYQAYFQFLDESGGFYYERFGDAPIHTLGVALLVEKSKIWFFRDIGYQHDATRHCPDDGGIGRCMCEKTNLDENFYGLVPMESPQRKPSDTCIRLWLGGEWLRKKEGWKRDVEVAVGGDGFGGYARE